MPNGVAAYGQTATTDPAHHADIWVVRTSIDGMVHFDPASGFDTINGAVQWSDGPAHTVAPLHPPGRRHLDRHVRPHRHNSSHRNQPHTGLSAAIANL